MAKINEQQIIDFYSNRKQELQKELTKIENVLSTLQETEKPKRRYIRKALVAQPAVKPAKKTPGPKRSAKAITTTAQPASSGPSLDERILTTLKKIGPSSKSDLIQELKAKHPEETPQKLSRGVALRLAMLTKKGEVQSSIEGDQVTFLVKY